MINPNLAVKNQFADTKGFQPIRRLAFRLILRIFSPKSNVVSTYLAEKDLYWFDQRQSFTEELWQKQKTLE